MQAALLAALAGGLAVQLANCATPKWIPQVAGPFRVIRGIVQDCPPDLQPRRQYVQYKLTSRRDRKHIDVWFFSGNVTTFVMVDDSVTLRLNVASWKSNGGWADGAYDVKFDKICTTLKRLFPTYWKAGMQALFHDENRDCPFPPGDYSFVNFSSDMDYKVRPTWFYGKFRSTFSSWDTARNEKLACVRVFFTIAPKVPKGQ